MIKRIAKLTLAAAILGACLFQMPEAGQAVGGLCLAAPAHAAPPQRCPPPRPYSGGCIQVIVWATDPATGQCCQYPDPCSAPQGWTISYSGCGSES
jgi:hypothetical protein